MSRTSVYPTKPDCSNTALHMAAIDDNFFVTYELVYIGTKVDIIRSDAKTPLMLAVANKCVASMKALLAFGADINVKDKNGESALSILFKIEDYHPEVITQFLRLAQISCAETEDLVDTLFKAGCALFHAAFFENIDVINGLLARGVKNYDATFFKDRTALHIATESDKLQVVMRLLEVRANVNAVDEDGCGALCLAATNGNSPMVRLLLERGADPNAKAFECQSTPLIAAMVNSGEYRQYDECVELLLEFGAVPTQKIGSDETVFDEALNKNSFYRINLVISHLALREMQGERIAEKMMECKEQKNRYAVPNFRLFFEMCQRTLKIKMFNSITLFDLLTASDYKFRVFLRNEEFYQSVMDSLMENGEISGMYPYYYDRLVQRLRKAPGASLQKKAIEVVCDIFGRNFNSYYVIAKEVVEYLEKSDLERVCEV